MSKILNSNYNDNLNIRRSPVKGSLKIGETVYGRVVKSIDVNEAIIKLMNGLELHAEVDEAVNELDKGLLKFIVESCNDNKVQLKIFRSSEERSQSINDQVSRIILAEGLSEEDTKILQSMLKFDMTLTRENIRDIKSLIQLKERMTSDPTEVNKFIDKYLNSKSIDSNSINGKNIKETLSEFFKVFNTLKMEDILLFLENSIDFSTETIVSYKNMFSENESINESINKKTLNMDKSLDVNGKNVDKGHEKVDLNPININRNINDVIDNIKLKVENLDIVNPKGIDESILVPEETNNELIKDTFNNLFKSKNIEISDKQLDFIKNIVDNGEAKTMDKNTFEKGLANVLGKEVILSDREYETITKLIQGKDSISQNLDFKNIDYNTSMIKEVFSSIFKEQGIEISNKELDTIKNTLSNNEIKTMDKSAVEKVLSNLLGKEVILSEKDYTSIVGSFKGKDAEMKNLEPDISRLPKEIIKEAISSRAEEGKLVIKNVLELLSDGVDSPELLGLIKNNISDIRLFNKLSNQYYYVNVPLNFNEKEYPCKIIIKDKRKEGKAIDSKNLKLVLTLKTSNFGTVDSYIHVLNRNINIRVKCNEEHVKVFEISKGKLERVVAALGFNVKVDVEKKQEEVSLITCREFFGDNNVAGIDIKV